MEIKRQSRIVLELQSDIMSMMRMELSRVTEGSSMQRHAGFTNANSVSSNMRPESHWDVQNGNTTSSKPNVEEMAVAKRLVDLEAKLEQVQKISKGSGLSSRMTMNSNGPHVERDLKTDTNKAIDRLTGVLDTLITELSEVRAFQGGSTSQLMSQLRAIESKVHAQDLRSTQMLGGADLVRVGSFAPMGMSVAPPHLYSCSQASVPSGGGLWALPTILAETMGLTEVPGNIDGEKDVRLDQFISVGAPGALWHASNEIVDDEPLVHSQHWDRVVSFVSYRSSSQNELNPESVDTTGGLGITDQQNNGDTDDVKSAYERQQSKQSTDIAGEFDNSGCINGAQIKPSPLKVDKRMGELKKEPFVPKSSPECSPKAKTKDDPRGTNSYSSTCKASPSFRSRPGHKAGIEVSNISDVDPSKTETHCNAGSEGTNRRVRKASGANETLISSGQSPHQEPTKNPVWKVAVETVPMNVETAKKTPNEICSKLKLVNPRREVCSCNAVDQSGECLGLFEDAEEDLDMLIEEMKQEVRQGSCATSSTAPDDPTCTPCTSETDRGAEHSDAPMPKLRRWSFPSFAFFSSICTSNLIPEQDSHMSQSLNIHEQPVPFAKGKLHRRNRTEVHEMKCRVAAQRIDHTKSLECGGQETICHGSDASIVENPLFGKKWASLKCEGAVKESGNTRINPLFDEDFGNDLDANGLPQYHAGLSTQLVSISALVSASTNSTSLVSKSTNQDNQLQWTRTIEA